MMRSIQTPDIIEELQRQFEPTELWWQPTIDEVPTVWVPPHQIRSILQFLQYEVSKPYAMLYDLTAIDERVRTHRVDQQPSDFTVVYHVLSFDRNQDLRLKVALLGDAPSLPSIIDIWPSANWYEREIWDLFGIYFVNHPHMRRILLPSTWTGHPLRKDHPARATEMGEFRLPVEKQQDEERALQFNPEDWGMTQVRKNSDFMFLNLGPAHTGTHGILRLVLQLDGEEIVDIVPDIGFHHRGAEKMAERQTWHTYIPYTDRIDYLGGVMNELPYVLAVEKLAGIEVPDRVKVIRVMMAELFRIASHLVWYGTFAQDVGQISPVFYMFTDREHIFQIVEAITGGRMHPGWFRIGGVAQDLPEGWETLIRNFLKYLPPRLDEYDDLVMHNPLFKARTQGIGHYTQEQAIAWGITGPGLRATGCEWDFRKARPYSGYEHFDFEIPVAARGDCYDRGIVRVEEMRQSLRIIQQCLEGMPAGPYKADHPLTTPPLKERTMVDIETLIAHFLSVSWGPVIPPGEVSVGIEATKGLNSYYLISDGEAWAYRARIRTPSFPHLQMVPCMSRGFLLSDLVAILGSVDYVLADVDR
ncbi:MAG: NADH-quinone oxidoreductase subunit C/D [Nitrospirales bacterium]|nr:MAG: NADH-quinone oxidoreductase subunit C/D [Nitrospirales bacterium]